MTIQGLLEEVGAGMGDLSENQCRGRGSMSQERRAFKQGRELLDLAGWERLSQRTPRRLSCYMCTRYT
eukprot:26087-Pelagomonas_calceolata.AAC.1